MIAGPTASGKTSLAIHLAKKYKTDIISADSRQCYRDMNIGVAKPTQEQLSVVKHYFINSHSIHDNVNAATFAAYAHDALRKIFDDHDVAIMAGGTGLYIKAFTGGLDEIPEVPASVRAEIVKKYETGGVSWLQEEVKMIDPVFYEKGEIMNPQRLMRALEVKLATGRSIKDFHQGSPKQVNKLTYSIRKYAIDITREQLYENINNRVGHMMEQGLLDEVKFLLPNRNLNALQTVGYTELFEYLDGNISLRDAVEKIKRHTRNYAKRQLTWFRKDEEISWITGRDALNII